METIGTWWMWAGFLGIVLIMLAIDLFVVGAKMLLIDLVKIPVFLSLGVVATIIASAIVLSLKKDARQRAVASSANADGR